MPFSARLLKESELSKIEKERFETTKIIYNKNTHSADVKLSVDYPVKGTNALLYNTRQYLNETIATHFYLRKYEGNLNDGNSVINYYGKAKYKELDLEQKENSYYGDTSYTYEESIVFNVDYENEYCVSFCAHTVYCHGGVSNSNCYASTFRKSDGKILSIIKSKNEKGLHRLIISAVKNKLGENYYCVNEDFESSPVAGIIHLVKNGVEFDYQHYEIGPGFFGQVSITIPYEKIKPYMTEEAKVVCW